MTPRCLHIRRVKTKTSLEPRWRRLAQRWTVWPARSRRLQFYFPTWKDAKLAEKCGGCRWFHHHRFNSLHFVRGKFLLLPRGHLFRRLAAGINRSEEHTSELQLLRHLVCRLLLE